MTAVEPVANLYSESQFVDELPVVTIPEKIGAAIDYSLNLLDIGNHTFKCDYS